MKKFLVVLIVMVVLFASSAPVFAFNKDFGTGGGMPGAHGAGNMKCASVLKGATAGHILGW